MSISTKGQSFIGEYILAVLIFTMTLFIFYKILPTMKLEMEDNFEVTYMDVRTVAQVFSTKGYPINWTPDDVQNVGLINKRRNLSEYKLEGLRNLSRDNYEGSKSILNIHSDYAVYFLNSSNQPVSINGIDIVGNERIGISGNGTNITDINYNNLLQIERTVMYDKKTLTAVVMVWS